MLYTIALFLHVSGAIGLFIAMSLYLVSVLCARQAQTVERLRDWISLASKAGPAIGGTSLFLVIPAIYMVATVWGFGAAWIIASIILFILQWMAGPIISGRYAQTIAQAAKNASPGPISLVLSAQLRSPALWFSEVIRVALLIGIVFLMTNKPGLIETLIVSVIALILGLICALLLGRSGRSGPAIEVS
jgi:hypothetical protein